MWEGLGRTRGGSARGEGGNGRYDTMETSPRSALCTSQQGSENREGLGTQEFLAPKTRPRGSSSSLRTPPTGVPTSTSSSFPGRNVSALSVVGASPSLTSQALRKTSSNLEAITEPRRANLEGSGNGSNSDEDARLELARQQNPRYSSRAGLRRPPPSSFPTNSVTAVDRGAAVDDGRAGPVSPLGRGTARRRGGSSGSGEFGAGSPKTEKPATAAAAGRRIPVDEFEMCAGGNFAVFLALRWVNNFSGSSSGSGESGFEMLVRLALREARHSFLGSFAYWRPGGEHPSRRGRPDNDQRQGITSKDGNRHHSRVRFSDMPIFGRSSSVFSSLGSGGGGDIDSGRAQPSAAVHYIRALITDILRDNFLGQVGTGMMHGDAGLGVKQDC